MRSVNKVIIIGNLTRDPELRQTPNNQSVATFGVATNRAWVTQGSEKKQSAEFHECVAWAKLAEICSKFLKKGHLVYIEGYLKTRNWETPEGIKKFKTEIVVQDMILLEKRMNGESEEEFNHEAPMTEHGMSEPTYEDEYTPEPMSSEPTAPSEPTDNSDKEDPISKDLGL